MICPRCQNQLPDNSIACNRCGLMFQYQMPQQQFQQIQKPKKSNKKLIIGIISGIAAVLLLLILIPFILSYVPKTIDYGDAKSFEKALNEGENCEGKIVKVKIDEIKPNSFFGYNLWSGEHLNFISSGNPNVGKGEYLIAQITDVDNVMGSWMIRYRIVRNAKETSSTIKSD